MNLSDQFTQQDKDAAALALDIAIKDSKSKEAREYLTYIREQHPEIPVDADFTQVMLHNYPIEEIERLQYRWMSENCSPNPAS
jgi:hypothetical protein